MSPLLSVLLALLQTAPPPPPRPEPAGTVEARPLDLAQREITEENFQASRALRLQSGDGAAISVDAGATVAARRIQLTLRNVKGDYRFRARLDAIHQRLQAVPDPEESGTPAPQ
jgi:hypothetical protein